MKTNKMLLYFIILIKILIPNENNRIITIGGCVTETVFKLGAGEQVVAVDQSSTSPKSVEELPQVGYIRAISSEGILSMLPNKILTTTDIGPPNVIDQISKSGVELKIFNSPHNYNEILNLVEQIALFLDLEKEGNQIKDEMNMNKLQIDNIINQKESKKIIFFMNPTSNSYNAAGSKTRADYLIEFIGGKNIFKNQFSKYKKVTNEEIINANPDIILVASIMNNSEDQINSIFMQNDEFKYLNAVKNNKIINIDLGKYLTFGPEFAKNALFLIQTIYD